MHRNSGPSMLIFRASREMRALQLEMSSTTRAECPAALTFRPLSRLSIRHDHELRVAAAWATTASEQPQGTRSASCSGVSRRRTLCQRRLVSRRQPQRVPVRSLQLALASKDLILLPHRFPHPLLTTVLHLNISLVALLGLSLLAQALLPLLPSSRRLLSTPRPNATSTNPSPITPRALLLSLASNAPSRRFLLDSLTPYTLSASLLTVLASLIELRAARITEIPFWTLTRLLPFPIVLLFSSAHGRARTMLAWGVLVAGPAVGWKASAEGMPCGASYAVCLAGWVLAARKGFEEGEKEEEHVG